MATQKRNNRRSSAAAKPAPAQSAPEQLNDATIAVDEPLTAEAEQERAVGMVADPVEQPAQPVEQPPASALADTVAQPVLEPRQQPAEDLSVNEAPTLTLPVFEPQADEPPVAPAVAPIHTTAAPAASPMAERSLSPAEERAVYARRRMFAIGGIVVALLLVGLLAYRFIAPPAPPAPPAQVAAPPAEGAPAAPAQPGDVVPPAAPAAPAQSGDVAPPAAPAAGAPLSCEPVPGLPVIEGATCVKHDRDEDDGKVEFENTYTIAAPADQVRLFYEQVFTQAGWRIDDTDHDPEDGQWEYSLEQGERDVKVSIETQGNATELKINEN